MPKTAPDLYEAIAAGRLMALEPIIDGNTAAFQGLRELAENVNWCIRHLRPQCILDAPRSTTNPYLAVTDQGVPANWTDRLVYRIPPFAAVQAAPLLRLRAWSKAGAATTGELQVLTLGAGATSGAIPIAGPGDYAEGQESVAFDPAVTETVVWQMRRWAGAAEVGVKSVSAWPDVGDNPVSLGVDSLAYDTPEPLATHMRRTLASRLLAVLKGRRGCVISYSDDVQNVRTFQTTGTTQFRWRVPVWYGPLTQSLRIWINGSGDAGSYAKFWTETAGYAAALSLAPVLPGAFDARLSWVTGVVPLIEQNSKAMEVLNMELYAPSGTTRLSGICVWEEPVP